MVLRFRKLGVVVGALTLVLAACGDNSGTIAQTGTTIPTTSTTAAETTTTTAGTTTTTTPPTQLNVSGKEYSYDDGGVTSVPAGPLDIKFTNAGTEEHQATLIRLHDGKTLADLAAAAAADPTGKSALALADGYGGPNSTAPGATVSTESDVIPGNYLLICFIPGPDGVPHAAEGMVMPITVTAGTTAALGSGDGTITTQDYSFGIPNGFTGQGTYKIQQKGPQSHEVAIYKLADGKTFADAQAYLQSTAGGVAPYTPAGGIAALAPNGQATVTLDLLPGTYVFVCFLPDATDGAPHFTHGMLQQVNIS